MAAHPPQIRVELIERAEALQPLRSQWNLLLERSQAPCVFRTWEWVTSWLDVYGAPFALRVLLAWRGERLVGVAPLMIGKHVRYGAVGPRVLLMVGQSGSTLAEQFDFIVDAPFEAEVTGAFVAHIVGALRSEWDMILFERMLDASPSKQRLVELLRHEGLRVDTPRAQQAFYVKLPATMDDYLAERSANFRSQYRNSRRKLERLGALRLRLAGRDLAVAEGMRILGELHRQRFAATPGASFRTTDYVDFHSRVANLFAGREWLWLAVLELDGQPIGARYDYVYGNKMWCMQGGWDPRFSNQRPGMILTGAAIEWAIERGLAEYDFQSGEADYKRRWASTSRPMTGVEAFNTATFLGRVSPSLRALRHAMQSLRRGAANRASS